MALSSRELLSIGYSTQLQKYPASYNFAHKIKAYGPVIPDELGNSTTMDSLLLFLQSLLHKHIPSFAIEIVGTSYEANITKVSSPTDYIPCPFYFNKNFYVDLKALPIYITISEYAKTFSNMFCLSDTKLKTYIQLFYSIFLDCSKKSIIYNIFKYYLFETTQTLIDFKQSIDTEYLVFNTKTVPVGLSTNPEYLNKVTFNSPTLKNLEFSSYKQVSVKSIQYFMCMYLELIKIIREDTKTDNFLMFKDIINTCKSVGTIYEKLYDINTDTFADSELSDIMQMSDESRFTNLINYVDKFFNANVGTDPHLQFHFNTIVNLLTAWCDFEWRKEVFTALYNKLTSLGENVDAALKRQYKGNTNVTMILDEINESETPKVNRILPENIQNILEEKDNRYHYEFYYPEPTPNTVSKYYQVVDTLKLVNNSLSKKLKEIKTYNIGGKNSGLDYGRIDTKNIHKYKTSNKIFYNNTYKIKESDLGIGIVLDMSGSMSGDNIRNGKAALILLHEVLLKLKINHSIIGHNSPNSRMSSDIYIFHEFNEYRKKLGKAYTIVDARVSGCNCDSGALYYMHRQLKRIHNRDKICIIFSDGEPTHCSSIDLKTQIKAMEMDKIKVIGIGINLPEIAEYYTDYANAKNLEDMFEIVSKILKEHVLSKKD